MIRFFGFLIRFVLSILLVVLGLVFLGPFLVKSVDQWMGKAEHSQSAAGQLSVLGRVRALLNEKEMSEVGLDDLLRLIESEDSSLASSGTEADSLRMKVEQLGLSPSDLEALGDVYRDLLRSKEDSVASVEPSPSVEAEVSGSTGLAPIGGL